MNLNQIYSQMKISLDKMNKNVTKQRIAPSTKINQQKNWISFHQTKRIKQIIYFLKTETYVNISRQQIRKNLHFYE